MTNQNLKSDANLTTNHQSDEATADKALLNAWNTSNVTNMFRMFSGAESFNQPLNDWDTLSADVDKMFDQSGIDEDNYSAFVAGKVSKG